MKTGLTLSLGLIIGLSAMSQGAEARNRGSDEQLQQRQTQEFVDARMHETLSSIDRSLNTLVTITRGGEPPRKDLPMGHTVAGAAGTQRSADQPPSLPQAPVDAKILERKVQIHWNGSADALLSSISNQVGFSFSNEGRPVNTVVRIEADDATVQEVLELVARQISGQADIYVSLPQRSIGLVRR